MKAIAVGLLVVVGVLAWRLTIEVANNGQLRQELEQLTGQLADKSKLENQRL